MGDLNDNLIRKAASSGAKTTKKAPGPKDQDNLKNRDELDLDLHEEARKESEGLKALRYEPIEENFINQDKLREQAIQQKLSLQKAKARADAATSNLQISITPQTPVI